MSSLLPSHPGLLPYWLILISALSLLNTIQSYRTAAHALRTYAGPVAAAQASPFTARLFGTWTFLSCVVRLYAAYRIHVCEVYVLALWTFVVALTHFGSEWLIYRTMTVQKGLLPVMMVAGGSLVWMGMQWSFYVE